MPHYTSSGLKLYFEDVGTGPPFILLHGFGTHGGCWDECVQGYKRFFRVLLPDMRGCGRSDTAPPGYSTKDLSADIVALMDGAGIQRAHFAGWSLGGAVGVELAIAHPERLLSLSMHSSFAGGC